MAAEAGSDDFRTALVKQKRVEESAKSWICTFVFATFRLGLAMPACAAGGMDIDTIHSDRMNADAKLWRMRFLRNKLKYPIADFPSKKS
jgi:hypothetical protein